MQLVCDYEFSAENTFASFVAGGNSMLITALHGASAAKKHTAECFEFYKTITPYCNDSSESAREKGRKFVETLTPEAKEAFTGTVCSVHSITDPVMGLFGGK